MAVLSITCFFLSNFCQGSGLTQEGLTGYLGPYWLLVSSIHRNVLREWTEPFLGLLLSDYQVQSLLLCFGTCLSTATLAYSAALLPLLLQVKVTGHVWSSRGPVLVLVVAVSYLLLLLMTGTSLCKALCRLALC